MYTVSAIVIVRLAENKNLKRTTTRWTHGFEDLILMMTCQ